jgi:hypothetical protein
LTAVAEADQRRGDGGQAGWTSDRPDVVEADDADIARHPDPMLCTA